MKHLITFLLTVFLTLGLFADITLAKSPDTVNQNDVMFTRSGMLSYNSHVMTDLVHSNFMKRGTKFDEEVGIIADREWIIQILDAHSNGKLSIIKDGSTKKYTITIAD